MKKLLTLITLSLLSLTFVGTVEAQTVTNCNPTYGGNNCSTTGLLLDKKVKHPQQNQFVENLNQNDPKYTANQDITFRMAVTNPGQTELKNITVVDTLPNYLTAVKSTNSQISGNTVTHTIDSLKAGETKHFDIAAKIVDTANLPTNQGTTCVTNQAVANTGSLVSEDTSTYCIQTVTNVTNVPTTSTGVVVNPEPKTPGQSTTTVPGTTTKGGLPVYPKTNTTTTPSTGPETLALAGLLPSGALGYFLRRKAK